MPSAEATARQPRLDAYVRTDGPRAVVLVLHGGQERNTGEVQDKHASWWRMALMARSLRGWARRERLDLELVQYRLRGWNDAADPDPVADARWALAQIRADRPGVSVVLVGHSMGGRAACRVADDPSVVGVVGLAPWLPQGEPNDAIAGKRLRVLHGTADRWTSPRWSRDYVERSRDIALEATWEPLSGAGHFMFRQVSAWRRFVESSVDAMVDQKADPA